MGLTTPQAGASATQHGDVAGMSAMSADAICRALTQAQVYAGTGLLAAGRCSKTAAQEP